jgi:hypothetical protein
MAEPVLNMPRIMSLILNSGRGGNGGQDVKLNSIIGAAVIVVSAATIQVASAQTAALPPRHAEACVSLVAQICEPIAPGLKGKMQGCV